MPGVRTRGEQIETAITSWGRHQHADSSVSPLRDPGPLFSSSLLWDYDVIFDGAGVHNSTMQSMRQIKYPDLSIATLPPILFGRQDPED